MALGPVTHNVAFASLLASGLSFSHPDKDHSFLPKFTGVQRPLGWGPGPPCCNSTVFGVFVLFLFFETGVSMCNALAVLELTWRSLWPQTHRDLPASALVLGLKAWATMLQLLTPLLTYLILGSAGRSVYVGGFLSAGSIPLLTYSRACLLTPFPNFP